MTRPSVEQLVEQAQLAQQAVELDRAESLYCEVRARDDQVARSACRPLNMEVVFRDEESS